MGKFYLYDGDVIHAEGTCPDGQEDIQAFGRWKVGLGDPPGHLQPEQTIQPPTYDVQRALAYPSVGSQLDCLWHAMNDGVLPKVEPFYSNVKAVKEQYPKPKGS